MIVPTSSSQVTAGAESSKSISITPTTSGTYTLLVAATNGTGSYVVTTTSLGVPVYRFFDTNYGTQFLTANTQERDTIKSTRPDLTYEGVGLKAAASNDPNASPVYRFFDTHYGTHFYTSSSSERDTIQSTRPDLTFEGVGFNEFMTQQAGSTAVYRFFDSNRGTHFFTASATEQSTILKTRPDLVPEGISFYSPNS